MTMVYMSYNDLGPAMRLKGLIGESRVARFRPGEHPLGGGFAALETRLRGQEQLTLAESQELGRLLLAARVIESTSPYWEPDSNQFARDLARAASCAAILFELHVIVFALEGKAEGISWRRYSNGTPDIFCDWPLMAVECKLIRTSNLDRIFDRIEEARSQHRTMPDRALVVAVGFERNLAVGTGSVVEQECSRRGRWFIDRPEISAVLIFEPHDIVNPIHDELNIPRVQVVQGTMHEVRIHRANITLPSEFAFGRTGSVRS